MRHEEALTICTNKTASEFFLAVRAGSIAVFFHEKSVILDLFRKFPSVACFPTSKLFGRDDSPYSGMRASTVVLLGGALCDRSGRGSKLHEPIRT